MKQTFGEADRETTPKTKKELTCPLCRAPLIGEAIQAGKCQCCGHRFDPKALKNQSD